jgi:hypothetical protein
MTPTGYESMGAGWGTFSSSDFEASDSRAIIQWIWKGLKDGAELSLQEAAPLLGMA